MKTILIVEDELTIVEVLADILREAGYQVIAAGNGQEALTCLESDHPDIILSDMMMPEMGGEELCKRLSSDPVHSSIPLVLMSSAYGSVNLDGCKYAAFLKKPFGLGDLLSTVHQVLSVG